MKTMKLRLDDSRRIDVLWFFLKGLKSPVDIYDGETGEIMCPSRRPFRRGLLSKAMARANLEKDTL